MQDAFCPHLGAHLGHGGTVDGLRSCARSTGGGSTPRAPTSTSRTASASTARPGSAPTRSWSATASSWSGTTPTSGGAHVGGAGGPRVRRRRRVVAGADARRTRSTPAWQEMAENGVDSAHFRYVHNTATVPELEQYETGVHRVRRCGQSQKFPTPRGVVEGRIDTTSTAPACRIVRFSGIVDTAEPRRRTTPIERRPVHHPLQLPCRRPSATRRPTSSVGKAFADEVHKQIARGQADLGAQGPPRAPGARRQRRPVHEVPQVVRAVLRRGRVGDERDRLPAALLARADGRDAPAKATASAKHGR